MPRGDAIVGVGGHFLQPTGRHLQAIPYCTSELVHRASREEPPILATSDQLRDSGYIGRQHGPPQCHRFHDHYRQSLGEARQYQRTRLQHRLAHGDPADPAGDLHAVAEPVARDERLQVTAHWPIPDQ